ncbi:hypothetical protein BKA93DRAFT_387690 [Sparassis latifolia]
MMSSTLRVLSKRSLRQLACRPAPPYLSGLFGRTTRGVSSRSWLRSDSRISTMFGTLIALGVVSTAYGLYEFYSAFTMWPEEVRADLRAGVKAKRQDNLSLSEKFFQRAWDTAQTLSLSHFGTSPYLKLSGIAIALAEVLEAHERPQPAWDVYVDAIEQFTRLRKQGVPLSGPERMRAVAIASKLGEMAETYQLPLEDEEQWLSWAVSELMKILKEAQPERGVDVGGDEPADVPLMLAELEMPPWVNKTTLGAPLEALGNFYARRGKVEYAVPLYLQAINLLVPPSGSNKTSTTEEKCRGLLGTSFSQPSAR